MNNTNNNCLFRDCCSYLNVNQSNSPKLAADSDCSVHYASLSAQQANSFLTNMLPTLGNSVLITLPNRSLIASTHVGLLPLYNLSKK